VPKKTSFDLEHAGFRVCSALSSAAASWAADAAQDGKDLFGRQNWATFTLASVPLGECQAMPFSASRSYALPLLSALASRLPLWLMLADNGRLTLNECEVNFELARLRAGM